MSRDDQGLLLVIRPEADVLGACHAAADFLRFRLTHVSPDSGAQNLRVIAVWVDGAMVDIDPAALDHTPGGIQVGESVGVNGVWWLYWLEVDVGTTGAETSSVRARLLSALMAARCPSGSMPLCVPVFDPARQGVEAMHVEARQLTTRFPGLIGTPLVWNHTSGIVRLLDARDDEA